MEEIVLDVEKRKITGKKVKRLRREGYVPAVVYGHRTQPINLKVNERALHQALKGAGANRLFTLKIKGVKKPKRVLAREWQRDAITNALLHIDFYEVVMTEKIKTELPVVLVGESLPVKNGEGLLFQGLDSIEIECLPGDLPPQIEVNVEELTAVDQAILVRDLKLSEGVEILTDPDEVVVKILPPAKEEVEEEVAAEEVPEAELVGEEEVAAAEEETTEA